MSNEASADERRISLEPIRADGWFERFGESIGSFHTLCEVLGSPFFAFALIADVRISSLMIDRFNPDQSLIEFTVGADAGEVESERMSVASFRETLVERLLDADADMPALDPKQVQAADIDKLQALLGTHTLLLAPIFRYRLEELVITDDKLEVVARKDAERSTLELSAFRDQLEQHIRDELRQAREMSNNPGSAIDLNDVETAEQAAEVGDWRKVIDVLGRWPMPLSIYWRTPEGQMLQEEARQRIAQGLGLLGTAFGCVGDSMQGEEVLRLAIQYAQDGTAAGEIFARLGHIFMKAERFGEAIAPFRRAEALGVDPSEIMVSLAEALLQRGRFVAALAVSRHAIELGVPEAAFEGVQRRLEEALGDPLTQWTDVVSASA